MQSTSPGFRPWLIVGFSFLALALSFSTRAVFGLVMPLLEEDLGWTRSFTSGVVALALVMMALIAPFAGRMVDRHGARAVVLLGLGGLAVGCFLVITTTHPFAFVLSFSGIVAVGFGLVSTHVVSAAVAQEIKHNQGLATGIATSGATAGQFLLVPAAAILISFYDWRAAFAALGAAAILMAFFIARWYPGAPDGPSNSEPSSSRRSLLADARAIVPTPAFQILFWSYFICGYTSSGVIETHFLPYASFCGFGPIQSASAYGILSAVNLGGMILAGWLTDRMNRPLLLGMIYLLRGATFIILVNAGAGIEVLIAFSVLFGLFDYSTVPVTASLVASHIGVKVMGFAFGLISAGHAVGAANGAYFGGALYDLYARYDLVWWSSLGLLIFAGAIVFLLREHPRGIGRDVASA